MFRASFSSEYNGTYAGHAQFVFVADVNIFDGHLEIIDNFGGEGFP